MDRLISWTTLISNLCVVAGIVFVIYEIRQNSAVAAAAIRQEIAHTDLTAALAVAGNRDVAEILDLANDGKTLTSIQERQLRALVYSTHRRVENVYQQYRAGMIDADQWHGYLNNLRRLQRTAAMQYYTPENYSQSFQALLESVEDDSSRDDRQD